MDKIKSRADIDSLLQESRALRSRVEIAANAATLFEVYDKPEFQEWRERLDRLAAVVVDVMGEYLDDLCPKNAAFVLACKGRSNNPARN